MSDEGVSERIDLAAIQTADGEVYTTPRPGRHHTIINGFAEAHGVPFRTVEPGHEQGFTTTWGRFVDREEACKIARLAGQILQKTGGPETLYSEDVW